MNLLWSLIRKVDSSINLIAKKSYSILPYSNPSHYNLKVVRDIDYRLPSNSVFHKLDAYYKPNAELKPVVLYVHGGGFATLSKNTHQVMALNFAARGYPTFAINYRLSPEHKFPLPLEDCIDALLWVVDNAEKFNGDPNQIILAGESAGANLVTALTLIAKLPREEKFAQRLYERNLNIKATVPVYGLLNLNNINRFNSLSPSLKFIIGQCAKAYLKDPASDLLASPLAEIYKLNSEDGKLLPPFFIPCGTADPLFQDSKQLHLVLDNLGVHNVLSTHKNQIHGFNALMWKREAKEKWNELGAFLVSIEGS